ncbi:MAG: hypothetical protein NT178_08820 [Proteobacteria bacterium]|nr:hypothetical protein [Pseudomonadota bacterium]
MRETAGNGMRIRIMFEDEACFGPISNPRCCWAPKGIRPAVSLQLVREYLLEQMPTMTLSNEIEIVKE